MRQFYRAKAAEFEGAGKYKDAEKAYLAAGNEDVDKAIAMYKRAKMYDQMVRLVTTYRKEKLPEAHTLIAQQLEAEGNLREAERHFVEAKVRARACMLAHGRLAARRASTPRSALAGCLMGGGLAPSLRC